MITRENYEELFLLYVDNELSATDRQAVDEFVAANPDLKAELMTLLECRLQPENEFFFEDRDLLLQGGEEGHGLNTLSPIDLTNFSEWFLSYVDAELDANGRRSVDEFAHAHSSLLPELTLLQQTVSSPDKDIVFENKASLYREEKRRIVFAPFFRIVAAAIALGAIGLLTLLLVRKNGHEPVAYRKNIPPPVTTGTDHPLYPHAAGSEVKKDPAQLPERIARSTEQEAKSKVQRRQAQEPESRRAQKEQDRLVAKAGTEDMGDPSDGMENKSAGVPLHTRTTEPLIPDRDRQVKVSGSNPALADAGNKVLIKAATPLIASTEPLAFEEDESEIASSSTKKNKLRGFFRKVSRTFDKTASRNEDEGHRGLLVGNLQIALK